ncbi:MAG: hypothetical protein K0S29_1146 [Gammaproteobacteria bacterium]|nr:hypothetical protein [Gammaproteobacteria bacterium]
MAINCEDIEAFSEEKKQEIINKAKLFIEMEKMKAYLGKCNSFRVFGFEVVMKAEGKLGDLKLITRCWSNTWQKEWSLL